MSLLGYITGANNRNKLRDAMDAGAIVIDIRPSSQYLKGHFKDARNMPSGVINSRIDILIKEARPIIIYGETKNEAASVVEMLSAKGILALNGKTFTSMQSLMMSNF